MPKTDEKTHKRLKNIRKELARRARHVSEDGSGQDDANDDNIIRGRQKTMEELLADSSDDDLDDDQDGRNDKNKNKKKGGGSSAAWIHEGGEGIVDLLSRDAASRISSTRPKSGGGNANTVPLAEGQKRRKGAESEFKVGADGRLIITEKKGGGRDSDEEEGEEKGRSGKKGNRRGPIVVLQALFRILEKSPIRILNTGLFHLCCS